MDTKLPPSVVPGLSTFSLATVECAPAAIAAVEGANLTLREVNAAFSVLLGKTKEELVGKSLAEVIPGQAAFFARLDQVYRTGKAASHVDQHGVPPPGLFWAYTIWPVMNGGRPVGVAFQVAETGALHEATVAMNGVLIQQVVRQDELTHAAEAINADLNEEVRHQAVAQVELKQTNLQLGEHAAQLEAMVAERTAVLMATNKQLEALVYSIAHDLRAPLRSMEGFTTLLVEEAGTALSATGRDYAKRVNKSAQYMDALLAGLLAFSRISQEPIELVPVDLKAVVEPVLSRLQEDIQEKGALVEHSGPWPSVLAEEPMLTEVLFNLTSNALKFVRPGKSPRVRLRAVEQSEFVRVWVEDEGLGIPPDYQAQIFRLFTRLNGETYPGTGFGLAIVEKGVERMGGRVGVESVPDQGSRFWFELRKA